jgi:hypothetical protein
MCGAREEIRPLAAELYAVVVATVYPADRVPTVIQDLSRNISTNNVSPSASITVSLTRNFGSLAVLV